MPAFLPSFLSALNTGLLLVKASTGQVLWANQAVQSWANQPLSQLQSQPLKAVIRLNNQVVCPLCAGQGEGILEIHAAFLHVAPAAGQEHNEGHDLKVKLKHTVLPPSMALELAQQLGLAEPLAPEALVVCLLEAFGEDASISSAHSDFVSTVSHEFRTPLTSIKGFADTMIRYGDALPPEQSKRFVIIIKDQADRLTRMVENLLSVSKLGAGGVDLAYKPIALKPLLEKIIQTVESKAATPRTFVLNVQADLLPLWSDPDKLEQILLNLIDNAVKYSFENTTVTVTAAPSPNREEWVELNIADQGVGIAPEHLPKMFSKFSRIDNPLTRNVEGTGLGLYITKSLTLALGGTITATSMPGTPQTPPNQRGTNFLLTFPLATATRQEAYRRRLLVENTDGSPSAEAEA